MFIKIRSILAENESKNISENVKWSYRRRFMQGILNTINGCFGYFIDDDYNWTINEQEAVVVRKIYDLYLHDHGIVKIIKWLRANNILTPTGKQMWSKTTVTQILTNEKYIGDYLLQKTSKQNGVAVRKHHEKQYYVENCHEPIISRETFAKVQELMAERGKHVPTGKPRLEYEFSGKIKCELCGKSFKRRINKKIRNFSNITWICQTFDTHGVDGCRANQIGDELLKEIAVDAYNEYLDTHKINESVSKAKAEITELAGKEQWFRDLMTKGMITYPQFATEMKTIKVGYSRLGEIIQAEQGDGLYKKQGVKLDKFAPVIADEHIEQIRMRGYKITFVFRNKQEVTRRYKYEHRRYCKDDD
jgi:hypothetical protein